MAEESHQTKGLLRLTMACNERCPFCNVPVEDYPQPTPEEAEIQASLDTFIATGARTLTVSGGEPTLLRGRLLRLIQAARQRGVDFVELQTNAILITPDYAAALAAAGLTSAFVSLLSDQPDLHDALTGLPGSFFRCLAGIDALIAAGVAVTLNPVTATSTQARLPDYIGFVASRLPQVRAISVSAVQPHGRAATDRALMPDYAALGPAIRAARRRAADAGIKLLNPYCGVPLCVGWEDGLDVSVEAIEARFGGGEAPNVENRGDKTQGPPCRACVLRARCGGAWFAYWAARGGSGLVPPAQLRGPWGAPNPQWEAVVTALPFQVDAPFIWLWTRQFSKSDAEALLTSGASGVALEIDAAALRQAAALRGLHHLQRLRPGRPPQHQPAAWLGAHVTTLADAVTAVEIARALGVDMLVLLVSAPAPWQERFVVEGVRVVRWAGPHNAG